MQVKIKKNKFILKLSDGIKFSKISKDFNKIHINKNYGYNSIYGQNIVHGVLSIIFFFKNIQLNEKIDFSRININFLNPLNYNEIIYIKQTSANKNKANFLLIQNNQPSVDINIEKIKVKKKIKTNIFLEKNFLKVLKKISWYTGMIYPGENSLLQNINILKFQKKQFGRKFKVLSKKLDSRLPIINNSMDYRHYKVNFRSIERPYLKSKKNKPNNFLISKIKRCKRNVLIIGASQGIGRDLFNLFKYNKKIIKIATYFRNKIKIKSKNVVAKKINILKDISKIQKIILDYTPLNIYYFATPKILFNKTIHSQKIKDYKNYYVSIPLKILSKVKKKDFNFFYPSTTFINFNKSYPYSKIKTLGDKKVIKFCKKNKIKFFVHRFPAINSRQSITLTNPENQNLNEYLMLNKKVIKNMLFYLIL